ncbi:MAG: SdpI family protein [Anaerovorax sp.]|nr:SdpI family protein [Anaerovorax sp.]
MGFWIFMLIMDLLIPLTMLGIGKLFKDKTPQNINSVYGYRTTMSMKNKETWKFAHKYCGKIWINTGTIMLPISMIIMFMCMGNEVEVVGTVGGVLCAVQTLILILSIFPTEIALKKVFDANGRRKE